jgi:uncharacterized protein
MTCRFVKDCRILVHKDVFSYVKATKFVDGAFAYINDGSEISLIIEETKINMDFVIEIIKNLKILTFDMNIQFEIVGIIAEITSVLASEGISIFIVSGFSTDHLIIKEMDYEKSISRLTREGFEIAFID